MDTGAGAAVRLNVFSYCRVASNSLVTHYVHATLEGRNVTSMCTSWSVENISVAFGVRGLDCETHLTHLKV